MIFLAQNCLNNIGQYKTGEHTQWCAIINRANGGTLSLVKDMTIPCQALKKEGVTTMPKGSRMEMLPFERQDTLIVRLRVKR